MLFKVCPQWWSFANVRQLGVYFSKKIRKIKKKFDLTFRCSSKLIFFNEKKSQKDSNDF